MTVPEQLPSPMSSGSQLMQKVGTLTVKACLSSIPLASLVFDIGQAGVDFANARLTERLLENICDRVGRLEGQAQERLRNDAVYQLSAQAALRKMLSETNPRMADALARAVSELGASKLSDVERLEIARALDVLTEPSLHLLQMCYRANPASLTEREIDHVGGVIAHPSHFSRIVTDSMPLLSWVGPMSVLEGAGLVQSVIDGGDDTPALGLKIIVRAQEVLPLGERVLNFCFDDPNRPAFGAFAEHIKDDAG